MADSQRVEQAWKAAQYDNINELKTIVPTHVHASASTFSTENHVHTLLMSAVAHGSINCAKYLIENGASVNAKNFAGYSALHWAAYTGREETLQLLLDQHADIEARTEDGKTPLHIAAFRGHLTFVQELLKKGADINAVSSNGWTALHYALISNQKSLCKFLIDNKIQALSPDSEGKTILDLSNQYRRTWLMSILPQP